MIMPPGIRKFVLTSHVIFSVGWLGSVVAFLTLTVIGLNSQDSQMVRAIYLVGKPLTWFAIVPLALGSLLSGIIQSLGTPWGLFRHYWVLFKLLLTAVATLILLQYTQTVSHFAGVATQSDNPTPDGLWSYLLHSSGALIVLIVATILSIYKPRGLTLYGWRKQQGQRVQSKEKDTATSL